MLKDHIKSCILKNFEHEPTRGQVKLIENLSEFILDDDPHQLFILKGYAGTGKTTVISALVRATEELKIRSLLLAPTGRAAKVLSSYSKKPAFTIHKKIYRQKSSKDGFGTFVLNANLYSNTLFIVDEASMISNQSNDISIFGSGRLLNDLLEFVYNDKNCKLILIGDTAQLPPVGIELSPALDMDVLSSFNYKVKEIVLTQVLRQSEESGICLMQPRYVQIFYLNQLGFQKFRLISLLILKHCRVMNLLKKLMTHMINTGWRTLL